MKAIRQRFVNTAKVMENQLGNSPACEMRLSTHCGDVEQDNFDFFPDFWKV